MNFSLIKNDNINLDLEFEGGVDPLGLKFKMDSQAGARLPANPGAAALDRLGSKFLLLRVVNIFSKRAYTKGNRLNYYPSRPNIKATLSVHDILSWMPNLIGLTPV